MRGSRDEADAGGDHGRQEVVGALDVRVAVAGEALQVYRGKRLFISHLSISGLKCGGRARQRGGKGGRGRGGAVTAPIPIIALEKALFLFSPFVPREEFASLSLSLSSLSLPGRREL